MSKEVASAELQASTYWKNVARSDRAEVAVAGDKASELTTAAQRKEEKPSEGTSRKKGLSAG